jgi:Asp-tRNA(Asn)/Glu-tRNA(Gln) amidotransferase C subunit
MVNKFNIRWQIVRVKARGIKDVSKKISYVMNFLTTYPNMHNRGRVLNWLKMTSLGYKNEESDDIQRQFDRAIDYVDQLEKQQSDNMYDAVDLSNSFRDISTEDLEAVYKDLSKRKYGFQYDRVPKAHTEFVQRLKEYLDKTK